MLCRNRLEKKNLEYTAKEEAMNREERGGRILSVLRHLEQIVRLILPIHYPVHIIREIADTCERPIRRCHQT